MKKLILTSLLLVACAADDYSTVTSALGAPTISDFTVPVLSTTVDSPAGTLVGDWVVTIVWSQGTITPVHTLQAGYAALQARTLNDGNTDGRLSVAYRVADADGAVAQAPYVITNATAGQTSIMTLAISGVTNHYSSGTYGLSGSAPNPPTVGQGALSGDWTALGIGGWQMTQSKPTVAGVLPTASGGDSTYTMLTQNDSANHVTHLGIMTRQYTGLGGATLDPPPFTDNQTPNGTASITQLFQGM